MEEFDKEKLIIEEQRIVDTLIATLEREIKNADDRLQNILCNYRKAKEQGPEAYGVIVEGQDEKKKILNGIERAKQSKDELYTCRLILRCDDGDENPSDIELKIGLSTYVGDNQEILVCDWKRDVCRHFLLDNCAQEYDSVVTGKNGEIYETHYTLKLKRNIETRFSIVRDVTHLFPLTAEEAQQIIYDAFLSELANRRQNVEFQNIIFSIQRKQGEIIRLPYDEDIIVQGCAGSGKSMIMLHRLPILIYDNPDILNSSNIYIISPSEAYIQMVENMREELEITNLKMGTLNQYYDYVLSKYGINLEIYGRVSYATKVTREQEEYIYGRELSADIQKLAQQLIDEKNHDFSEGLTTLGLLPRQSSLDTIEAKISDYIIMGNSIISANNNILKEYFLLCKSCLLSFKDIADKVKNRREIVLQNVENEISKQKDIVQQKRKELEDISLGEVAIKNRTNAIKNAKMIILQCNKIRYQVEKDDDYFQQCTECCYILDKMIELFDRLKPQFEDNSRASIYAILEIRRVIYKGYRRFLDEISKVEKKYLKYKGSMLSYAKKYEGRLSEILTKSDEYLDLDYFNQIIEATAYYTKLQESIVQKIYLKIMEKCGQASNEKGEIKGLMFSPYLYLKIMYLVKGAPNAAKEKLICIDEAQGLAPTELKLIKDINGNQLILNLFGDVKQHIEGTKGIDSWKDFQESINATENLLMENYRNASQITEECNRRFGMEMKAINTPGSGVFIFSDSEEFDKKLRNILLKVQKSGICAIVVNDEFEAKQLLSRYVKYQDKIHDLTEENFDIHRTRWNLLTVEQSKGLEFGSVIAISGRMTPNRKYIAFTRALDELFIYDLPLPIEQKFFEELEKEEKSQEKGMKSKVKEAGERKVPVQIDYSKSEVRKYFESKGLEVYDMRPKGGVLWIVGEQAEIKQYVDEACEKFAISGVYSSSKAIGFRPGCYFKTKK